MKMDELKALLKEYDFNDYDIRNIINNIKKEKINIQNARAILTHLKENDILNGVLLKGKLSRILE